MVMGREVAKCAAQIKRRGGALIAGNGRRR
jgi:hypothetical protein